MSDGQRIHVQGVAELLNKLDAAVLAGKPWRNFLNRWALSVERKAKQGAPVWRGQLRRSITHEIDAGELPRYARVGTNAPHGEPMEFGTGLLSDSPSASHRRHFPPPAALDAWAISKGFHTSSRKVALTDASASPGTFGKIVSDIIGRRGGLKPRRYLRNAVDEAEAKIPGWLQLMAQEIEQGAARGA